MDTLGGFLQQPFVGVMLVFMCFFGLLLILVLAYIVRARMKRAATGAPVAATYSADYTHTSELPDLDMLVDTSSLISQTPARVSRSGTYALNLADGGNVDAVEVMTVLRDVVDGRLIVQISDKAYQSIEDSSDAEFRDRFLKVMRELSQMAAKVSKASASTPEATPAPAAQPPRPVPPAKPKVASTPTPTTPEGGLPGDLPKFRLEDQPPPKPPPGLVGRALGQRVPSNPIPEINIAGAIEAYLQHKLQNTPEYAGRSIHVLPTPDGGVMIQVDERYFDAVGEVDDAEVREFIATAIQEWQDRH